MPQQAATASASRKAKALSVLGALFAVAATIGLAAPAAADTDGYLQVLQTKYVYLSESQLLSEGNKICSVTSGGKPASDAVAMVYKDLGVSMSVANEIVVNAIIQLGC